MIYYCTMLKQTDQEEREAIEKEMVSKPELKHILNQLMEVENDDIVLVIFLIKEIFFNLIFRLNVNIAIVLLNSVVLLKLAMMQLPLGVGLNLEICLI